MENINNLKCKNVKFLEENVWEYLCNFEFHEEYTTRSILHWGKKKINCNSLYILIKLCSVKDAIKRMKRQARVLEKICGKCTSDKGLVPKT